MSKMHPVTWMYMIFIVPLAIAVIAYLGVRVYIRVRYGRLLHVRTLEAPNGRRFALFHGTESPGVSLWHVHELGEWGETPPWIGQSGNTEGAIFVLRYTDMLDPHEKGDIDLFGGRHLVFLRDGLFQGIFDIEDNRALLFEPEPQAKYAQWADEQGTGGAFSKEDYLIWVDEHLHRPIAEMLGESAHQQPPTPPRA